MLAVKKLPLSRDTLIPRSRRAAIIHAERKPATHNTTGVSYHTRRLCRLVRGFVLAFAREGAVVVRIAIAIHMFAPLPRRPLGRHEGPRLELVVPRPGLHARGSKQVSLFGLTSPNSASKRRLLPVESHDNKLSQLNALGIRVLR